MCWLLWGGQQALWVALLLAVAGPRIGWRTPARERRGARCQGTTTREGVRIAACTKVLACLSLGTVAHSGVVAEQVHAREQGPASSSPAKKLNQTVAPPHTGQVRRRPPGNPACDAVPAPPTSTIHEHPVHALPPPCSTSQPARHPRALHRNHRRAANAPGHEPPRRSSEPHARQLSHAQHKSEALGSVQRTGAERFSPKQLHPHSSVSGPPGRIAWRRGASIVCLQPAPKAQRAPTPTPHHVPQQETRRASRDAWDNAPPPQARTQADTALRQR